MTEWAEGRGNWEGVKAGMGKRGGCEGGLLCNESKGTMKGSMQKDRVMSAG